MKKKKLTIAKSIQANKRMNQSEVEGDRGIHPSYPNKRTKERAAARKLKKKPGPRNMRKKRNG